MARFPLERVISLDEVPPEGDAVRIQATADERAGLARLFGVTGIQKLEADVRIARRAGQNAHVLGHLSAVVVQPCVVTLEPVTQTISAPIAVMVVPEERVSDDSMADSDGDLPIDLDAEDEVVMETPGLVDIGALVAEQLALEINPYPRAPGAELPPGIAGEGREPSPFAALAALRRRGATDDGEGD